MRLSNKAPTGVDSEASRATTGPFASRKVSSVTSPSPAPAGGIAPATPARGEAIPPESLRDRLLANARRTFWPSLRAASWALVVGAVTLGIPVLAVLLALRFVNPPTSMLMLTTRLSGEPVIQSWVPLERISPHLQRAVIMSKDGQFCRHHGVDLSELKRAIDRVESSGEMDGPGASTITMQVAKNLFLWPGRSAIRKGLEIPLAVAIDRVWPKRRVLEFYLNIAEWDPGIFGAEAAARYHFRKSASRLTEGEAALLAVTLPDPIGRSPARPGPGLIRLARVIDARVRESAASHVRCLSPAP